MLDIVSAENLPLGRGMKSAVQVSALKNFRRAEDEAQARSCCRTKNVLLYSASYELDVGICKELRKSGGALLFSFSDVLKESGFRRAIIISKMRLALNSCRKSGCGFLACTLAKSGNEVRSAREIEAFMSVLGMNQHEKIHAEKTAERLAGEGGSRQGGSEHAEKTAEQRAVK